MHIYSKNMLIKFSEMQRDNIDTYLWSIFPTYTSFFSQVILKISREGFCCIFLFVYILFWFLFMFVFARKALKNHLKAYLSSEKRLTVQHLY